MSNEIEISGYKHDEIDTIKSVLGFRMSDMDLKIFLHICRETKLCPLRRQIYAIPRGNKMTIQTSIDGFRLIAERTGCYAPGRLSQFHYDDKGNLLAATAYVKKLAGGVWHEVGEQALLCEYMGQTSFWQKMPSVMLSKVAEMRALRRAFPDALSGLLGDDEMDQADNKFVPEPVVDEDPIISDENWEKIDKFINGRKDLREKITKFCKVSNLRNMKESQREAAARYAKKWIDNETTKIDKSILDNAGNNN